jgi:hypothetical protein
VIKTSELHRIAALEGIRFDQIEWNKGAWGNQLGPLMKNVPDFEEVWQEWIATFHRIFGKNNSI